MTAAQQTANRTIRSQSSHDGRQHHKNSGPRSPSPINRPPGAG
ncbi:hypothetical protein PAMC26510_03430 [Caballeronia sordidicola]|uniref:Uncharacterized protein n=1 Tax=Caballeronia sordidicola TaxID=196367 RepID=A0A242N9S2_CABSO|nr:hypothetical protein PAMC26510_03430 [Caballeronia sordidicola]